MTTNRIATHSVAEHDRASAPPADFPSGTGELAGLIRTFDWSSTPLGPIEHWPHTLRVTIDLMLQTPVPMVTLWGPDGIMIYNDGYAVVCGSRHPDVLGSNVVAGWPEVAEFNRNVLEVGLRGGTLVYRDQQMVLHRLGRPEVVWFDLSYSPILDEQARPIGVLAIVIETTDRVIEERRRRRAEDRQAFLLALGDRLRGLTDAPAAMYAASEMLGQHLGAGRVGYGEVDPAEELLAVEHEWTDGRMKSFTGRHRLDDFGPEIMRELRAGRAVRLHDVLADQRTSDQQVTAAFEDIDMRSGVAVPLIKGGRWVACMYAHRIDAHHWTDEETSLLFDAAERTWDTVERARAEDALRALNVTLEQHIEQRTRERDRIWSLSQDPFLIADTSGRWLMISPAWTEILGWSEADLLGRTSEWMEHPDDHAATREMISQLAAGQRTLRFENRFRRRDGSYRWFSWTAVPYDHLLYCVARDITEDKLRQLDLEDMQEQLRQAQKMEAIGQLTGGIAHDFNNLLTGIITGLDLLQRRIDARQLDGIDRYISTATTSARRAAALTHRLLAFSRRQSLDVRPTDVNALIRSLEDLLHRTIGESIQLETVLAPDLGAALSDANQLENALLNLCVNARDAMPGGGRLTLETRRAVIGAAQSRAFSDLAPGDYIVLSVSDTGVGMAPDVIERAFDPFFTTKPIGQGTGLGLSMIYGFMKQSGGHVRIYSDQGQGTTVKLYLPRDTGEAPVVAVEEAIGQPQTGAGEHVLIVEDDTAVRMVVVEVLDDLGYTTVEVGDAHAAIREIESGTPIDLLITDVGLPGMNGRQLAEVARQLRPALPVLFVTGYAEGAALRGGFLEPGMGLISKPFDVDALAAKVRMMIER